MEQTISTVVAREMTPSMFDAVDSLLGCLGLRRDADVELWALAVEDGEIVGCMGLSGDVVKCSALAESVRGQNLLGQLLVELRYAAIERGRPRLFAFTRPAYQRVFANMGFRALAQVPELAVLMEDDPRGIERYVQSLAGAARQGRRIGSVVVNANPFTLGHEHLIRHAAGHCDVVHVFVVGEDRSEFSYAERLELVRAGVAALDEGDRIVVHGGSRYVVSASTFPQYFLKDPAAVADACTGIDLQLFRNYIAPVLGIRHRYVGAEPANPVVAKYNADMPYWLTKLPAAAPAIKVHEIPRIGAADEPFVSASRVRALLADGRLDAVRDLVPPTTFTHLRPTDAEGGKE